MPKAIDVTDSDTGDGSPNMKSWSSKRNLMASSMPARDVTVSLGEGFIWLHPPFNGRIKSLIRSFCRALFCKAWTCYKESCTLSLMTSNTDRPWVKKLMVSEFSIKSWPLFLPLQHSSFYKGLAPAFEKAAALPCWGLFIGCSMYPRRKLDTEKLKPCEPRITND